MINMIREIRTRLMLLVGRCVLVAVNDSKKIQALQLKLSADETRDNIERFQQYGFTSVPLAGAEGIALSVGGERGHTVVIAVDDRRYRLTGLQSGEVALYNQAGASIKLKADGSIVAVPGASGTVKIGSASSLRKLIDDRIIAIYNAHVHPDPVSGVSGVPSVLISTLTVATSKTEAV